MARYQKGSLEEIRTAQGLCWFIRFTEGNGRRPRFQVGLKTQYPTEAKASRAAQTLRDWFNGRKTEATWTVADVVERYEREEMPERYSTRRGYLQLHRLYIVPTWGKTLLSEIDPLAVRTWLNGLDLSSRSKGHIHGQMRVLFKFALFWRWLPSSHANPMSLFSIKGATKRKRTPRVISPAQWRSLLDHFQGDLRMQTLVIGAYLLGLRASELFALKWADFDHHTGKVRIQRAVVDGRVGEVKTERSGAPLPLGRFVGQAFLAWRAASEFKTDDDWVFASAWLCGRQPVHSQHLQEKRLIPAGKAIGLDFPLGWHTFRHSCKVLLERAGTDVTVQRDYMRHSDVHTTMQVYGEIEFDRMQVAHEKAVQLAFHEER